MKIIESFTLGKKQNPAENEGGVYLGERFVAVIDGMTSKLSAPEKATLTSGCFARGKIMELLDNAISSAASLILYDQKTKNVISYGDCQMLYQHQVYKREKLLDVKQALMRSKILQKCRQKGIGTEKLQEKDPRREAIVSDILGSFLKYANESDEYGFGVLGLKKIVSEFVDVWRIQPEEVVLASDGYPFLYGTLEECEEALQQLIVEDPLLYKNYKSTKGLKPGQKSYDDRSYVSFIVKKSLYAKLIDA